MVDVGNIIVAMSFEFNWLRKCVMEFDVTTVGKEYSFKENIISRNFGTNLDA